MAHRVVLLMGGFDADRQRLVLLGTLQMDVQTTARNAQHSRQLAFLDRTAGSTQRARQFHPLLFAHLPSSPRDFFSSSFCTVRSPISFFSSSGDSPGSYPCALARLPGSRWEAHTSGPLCWNACRHRLTIEEETANLRHTSSMVVSRCKLSSTTLNLNSGK